MTGQDILNAMELVNPELQLQSGESDVTKALIAVNVAQDHLEALLATMPGCLGGQTGTVVTVANTETAAFPSTLLRLDKLQFIDAATNRPAWDLTPIFNVGGHAYSAYWPQNLTMVQTSGKPEAYWTNGTNIYFAPIPDDVYTIRYYGFVAQSDITASGTFAYKDIARMPMAVFACRILSVGYGDDQGDLSGLAREVFSPVLKAYGDYRADGGKGLPYKYTHDT